MKLTASINCSRSIQSYMRNNESPQLKKYARYSKRGIYFIFGKDKKEQMQEWICYYFNWIVFSEDDSKIQ